MEKKQIKISLGTFIATIVAIILVVVVMFMAIHITNQNKQIEESKVAAEKANKEETTKNSETTTNPSNVIAKELDINSELVQKLYGYISEKYPEDVYEEGFVEKNAYIPKSNYDTLLSYYRSEKITNATLEDDMKLIMTLQSLLLDKKYTVIKQENLESIYNEDTGTEFKTMNFEDSYFYNVETQKYEKGSKDYYICSDVYIFDMDNIQARAKEMFNTNINIQKHSFDLLGEAFVYDGNTYKYFQNEGGGDLPLLDESKLIKAEQKGDEIYIYDNYIKIDVVIFESDGSPIYASSDEKIRLEVNLSDINEMPDTKIVWKRLEQQGTGIPLYKHTFKKSNTGTYYWVSSELVNKNELKTVN